MRGIVASGLLKKLGHDVTLIERNHELGGVLCSDEWDGLYIDKGCHLLDFGDPSSAALYREILNGRMHPVERRYASIIQDQRSEDIAVPDLSALPAERRQAALAQLLDATSSGDETNGGTLTEALNSRFGEITGGYLSDCVEKMTAQHPDSVDASAIVSLPLLSRVRLGADAEMMALKNRSPALEARLAVSQEYLSKARPSQTPEAENRNQYPSEKGMRGFCEAARVWLDAQGVNVLTGTSLESITFGKRVGVGLAGHKRTEMQADYCYWAQPASRFLAAVGAPDPAEGCGMRASIVLFAFRVAAQQVANLTYIHDYRPSTLAFRHSTPGVYGRQTDKNGMTYVCIEVPCRHDQRVWVDPHGMASEVWREAIEIGLVNVTSTWTDLRCEKAVTLVFPRAGTKSAFTAQKDILQHFERHVLFGDRGAFGKAAIIESVTQDIECFLAKTR